MLEHEDQIALTHAQRCAERLAGVMSVEVVTDRAPTYPRVLNQLWPAAWTHSERYAINRIEADHAQVTRRLRAMRGIKTMTGLRLVAAGHALVQNLRRGHYEVGVDEPAGCRLRVAFADIARPSDPGYQRLARSSMHSDRSMQPRPVGVTRRLRVASPRSTPGGEHVGRIRSGCGCPDMVGEPCTRGV